MTSAFDPLWVPVLTHYRDETEDRLDPLRTAEHLRHLTPSVRQFLVSGTTGDGWVMSDRVLDGWLDVICDPAVLDSSHSVLVGALAETTEAVIARARHIEARLSKRDAGAHFAGLTICAQVDPAASQEAIIAHVEAVLAATAAPVALYQLPQVVGCELAPETVATLVSRHPRIAYLKDTSGADRVVEALDGQPDSLRGVTLLRGAEGGYAGHLKPQGRYDGWLLSTANGFAPQLRAILERHAAGDLAGATQRSDVLAALVEPLFALAADLPDGNPFSNANRGVDHLMAEGPAWRDAPLPRLAGGARLPEAFLAAVEGQLQNAGLMPRQGYRSNLVSAVA